MALTIIFGLSGSGKTTLVEYLQRFYGYKKVVTYTTRPKRSNEVDGVDYHFVEISDFEKAIEADFFIEYMRFYPHGAYQLYGTAESSISNNSEDRLVLILEPNGIKRLLSKGYKPTLVYLNEDQETCISRLFNRGDEITEIYRRMCYDLSIFRDFDIYLKMNDIPYLEFKNKTLIEMAERIVDNG